MTGNKIRRASSAFQLQREENLHHLAYLGEFRKEFNDAKEGLEEELRKILTERLGKLEERLMRSIQAEIDAGYSKSLVAIATGVSRQSIIRWMAEREDSGAKIEEVAVDLNELRFERKAWSYNSYPPHYQFEVVDSETGETTLLEPLGGNRWQYGKLQGPDVPREILNLRPDTEEEAYELAEGKAKQQWKSWSTTLNLADKSEGDGA